MTHSVTATELAGSNGAEAVTRESSAQRLADTGRLVTRARNGNRQAVEDLLGHCQGLVLRVSRHMLDNPADAQDAAQESLLKVFRHLDRFDPRQPLEPWLYRITVNTCRDHLRRHRRRPTASLDDPDTPVADPAAGEHSAEAGLVLTERLERLREAIQALSPRQRAAIVLRDVEGLPARDVARAMGISMITLRVHIRAARLKLRHVCGPDFGGDHDL
ncbi:MAG: sigma-70 family RNA polymerase sigma factor [Acidobacteria bacterium]|nr:sigma-70 family RNA polymerase sigma factor [Acidobacteriota bacterium]